LNGDTDGKVTLAYPDPKESKGEKKLVLEKGSFRLAKAGTGTVPAAFGFNASTPEKGTASRTGVYVYWNGRLIKPCLQVKCMTDQKSSVCKGMSAVVDVPWLTPIHTKEDFIETSHLKG